MNLGGSSTFVVDDCRKSQTLDSLTGKAGGLPILIKMPRPKNTTESDQSYDIPMRDGVRRAIRLYFPEGKVPTSPVTTMLIQTRYGRE